jgi:hypothetical protein
MNVKKGAKLRVAVTSPGMKTLVLKARAGAKKRS